MSFPTSVLTLASLALVAGANAQAILFDFDNLPVMRPFPLDVSVSGISAHLAGTGQGYSTQLVGTLGIAPVGMSGIYIYPSSVYLADLVITFSEPMVNFSIQYAPQELNTDSSCRMRVTAYMNTTYVGTNTFQVTTEPFFWPTGTLTFASAAGFNKCVVHYDAPPPTGGDYGVIFVADNMRVTPMPKATVNGQLSLGDWIGNTAGETANFQLRSGTTIVETVSNVALDASGHYSFQTSRFGSYTIAADVSHWLTKLNPTVVNLTSGGVTQNLNFALSNGDCDTSGEVDAIDIDVVIAHFGETIGLPNYFANADLDGSGEVDAIDIDVVINNFGAVND